MSKANTTSDELEPAIITEKEARRRKFDQAIQNAIETFDTEPDYKASALNSGSYSLSFFHNGDFQKVRGSYAIDGFEPNGHVDVFSNRTVIYYWEVEDSD